jgi:hypothetical protein
MRFKFPAHTLSPTAFRQHVKRLNYESKECSVRFAVITVLVSLIVFGAWPGVYAPPQLRCNNQTR